MPFNPYAVAALLKQCDIPVGEITDWQDHEDGNIEIDDKYHVQVGEYYLVLCWWENEKEETMCGLEPTSDYNRIIQKLKELRS